MKNLSSKAQPFVLQRILDLPADAIGVYCFWHGNRSIYVGKTDKQTLKTRLKQHYDGSHNDKLSNWISAEGAELKFSYVICSNSDEVNNLEKKDIHRLQPITNVIMFRNAEVN